MDEAEQDKTEDQTGPRSLDKEELVRFSVSMPAVLVNQLDTWLKANQCTNRSEGLRDMVRDRLIESDWQNSADEAEMVGVVTLVYQHNVRQLSDHLIQVQHDHHNIAYATLHVHLNTDNCLEVIVLRGRRAEVIAMAGSLISSRGVLHGKFVPTTTGVDFS